MAGAVDTTRPAHAGRLGYVPALDGLRAFAVLVVLVFHFESLDTDALKGGFLGVQMFFVISGFLITVLLLEEHERNGRIRLPAFYARRALRLFPALFAVVLAAVCYSTFAPHSQFDRTGREAVASLLYWDNWYHAEHVGGLSILLHTWSLSIEEQFYLLWPLVLIAGLALNPRALLLPLALAGAAALALERGLATGHWDVARLYYGTDTRADALLVGCALGLLWMPGLLARGARVLTWLALPALAALALLVHFVGVPDPGLYRGWLLVCSLATAVLVACAVFRRPRPLVRLLEQPAVVFVGKISYGLYLWHFLVFWIVRDYASDWSPAARVPLEVALSFLVAIASYELLELPVVRRKARFTPLRA